MATLKPIPIQDGGRQVSLARDDQGVIHIDAATWYEALYGNRGQAYLIRGQA